MERGSLEEFNGDVDDDLYLIITLEQYYVKWINSKSSVVLLSSLE